MYFQWKRSDFDRRTGLFYRPVRSGFRTEKLLEFIYRKECAKAVCELNPQTAFCEKMENSFRKQLDKEDVL